MFTAQNSVAIKLQGGLGNQLFQYAAGFSLSKRLDCNLLIDARFVGLGANRIYQLNQLNVTGKLAQYPELDWFPSLEARLMNKSKMWRNRQHFQHIRESHFHYVQEFKKYRGHLYLDGYWQSSKYFAEYASEIKQEFSFRFEQSTKMNEYISKISNSVAVHVRRGDYINNSTTNSYHGNLNQNYFLSALERLKKEFPDKEVYYFTDDSDWVSRVFQVEPTNIISLNGFSDVEEILIFASAQYKIISNSSFSWWGAWLGQSKKIIAPRNWFNPTVQNDTSDLYEPHWDLI
jgi:hypothetical protein